VLQSLGLCSMFQTMTYLMTLATQDAEAAAEKTAEVVEAASEATEVVPAGAPWYVQAGVLLGVVAVMFGPFILGSFIAKALRVQDWALRIGVSLFAVTLGLTPFVTGVLIQGKPLDKIFRLGIDLNGGTNLVFQVKGDGEKQVTNAVMDKMVGAVGQRINQSGTEEVTVRQVGADRIEVIVPGVDAQSVDEIKRKIVRLGSLEFFVCANEIEDREIVQQARDMPKDLKDLIIGDEVKAVWRPAIEKDGEPQKIDGAAGMGIVTRPIKAQRTTEDGKLEEYETEEYLLLADPLQERVTGKYLTAVNPDYSQSGSLIVRFNFNQQGGYLFGQLTGRFQPQPGRADRQLAIVLDRRVHSAPRINSVITDNGYIEGGRDGFTQEEAKELADVLNAGALEVPIDPKPLSEATIDPTLGADVRDKGVMSVLIGAAAVIVFMFWFYRSAGLIAILSLTINIILVMGVMVGIRATLTLPGLAGIVLTIGMAVDANVLIYERMREETRRGSSFRMAIQNGFSKAFSTIIDANVTTLLTAVILFIIGTDQVKGFAVTLFIGIVMSMFSSLFVGRLMFDIAEKRKWLQQVNLRSIVGTTNIDFLSKRFLCGGVSAVLIAVGLAGFFVRGDQNYDIDFTGGTMVTFQLKEAGRTEDVRDALATQFDAGAFSLERLSSSDEDTEGVGTQFRLRTTESDSAATEQDTKSAEERVSEKVYLAFNETPDLDLRMVSMDFTDPVPVAVAEDDDSVEALAIRRFNGGYASTITLSDVVAAGTLSDMVSAELQRIGGDDPKFADVEALFGIQGTSGPGMEAGVRSVRLYDEVILRTMSNVPLEDVTAVLSGMKSKLDTAPLFDEVNTFASAVASEMKGSALMAIILSMIAITGYIWFRFQNITFGLAALAALIHDVLIVLGGVACFSMLNGTAIGNVLLINDFRINLPMIAAFLTIVGYSLNDTIVVFDRIREVRGKNPAMTLEIVNESLNQTLSRTLLTSLTTFIVVIVLYIIGGEGIHGFAFCLTLGVLVGTYSSIYIASPILVWLMNRGGKPASKVAVAK
jgi:SecD/SecF fusion protein